MLKKYFEKYFEKVKKRLDLVDIAQLEDIADMIELTQESGNKGIFVGNGGSLSIASHLTIDCINAADLKAVNFNDPSMITCFSNDYGYENWVAKALECYADSGDTLVLISSSGQSKNMLFGAKKARSLDVNIITLTGFLPNNPLRNLGDINLWVDSKEYNIIEMTHHIWLLSIVDYIITKNKGMDG